MKQRVSGGGSSKINNSNSPGNSSSGSSGKSSSSSKSGNSDKGIISSKSSNQINRRGSGDVGRHGIVPIQSQLPGSRGSVADPTRMPAAEVKMIAAVKHQPIIRSNEALLGAAPSPRKDRVMVVKSPSPLVGHGNSSSSSNGINNNNLINDHRLRSSPASQSSSSPFAAKRCSNNPVLVTDKIVSSTSNNNNVNGGHIHLNKVSGTMKRQDYGLETSLYVTTSQLSIAIVFNIFAKIMYQKCVTTNCVLERHP